MSRLLGCGVLMLLLGCSDSELSPLSQQLSELKMRLERAVPPLPEPLVYPPVTYDQAGERSPFVPARPTHSQAQAGVVPTLNIDRPSEPLEAYPIEVLQLIGTLNMNGRHSALIRAPDGRVHRLQVGEYMGVDQGRIARIQSSSIALIETVPTAQGGWKEQRRVIAFASAKDEQARVQREKNNAGFD